MPAHTVAVFDDHPDTVVMLDCLLTSCGFRVIGGPSEKSSRERFDLADYIAVHDPQAIIWNVTPPVHLNWALFHSLRHTGPLANRAVVITTTNKRQLNAIVGQSAEGLEVVQKPYELALIVAAVTRAIAHGHRPQPSFGSGAQAGWDGSVHVNTLPVAGVLATVILPPWRVTSSRQM